MIRTRLCELFGIEHPIINAPMAAAVSMAAGLGMIGASMSGGRNQRPAAASGRSAATRRRSR